MYEGARLSICTNEVRMIIEKLQRLGENLVIRSSWFIGTYVFLHIRSWVHGFIPISSTALLFAWRIAGFGEGFRADVEPLDYTYITSRLRSARLYSCIVMSGFCNVFMHEFAPLCNILLLVQVLKASSFTAHSKRLIHRCPYLRIFRQDLYLMLATMTPHFRSRYFQLD
jgi:hypothetical protein